MLDLFNETHNTHHPIAMSETYDEQKKEAKRNATQFRSERLPKFLNYFEAVLKKAGGEHLVGEHSYVDLSMFIVSLKLVCI